MAQDSPIEWTDKTWNPIRGCTRVSEGCRNCYAEKVAARFSKPGQAYHGLAHFVGGEARWTGQLRLVDEMLTQPLRWLKPSRIFVNSMSDLFHENLSDADIDRVFAVMALAPRHTFQVLTKRTDRMRAYLTNDGLYQRILRAADPFRAANPKLCRVPISDPRQAAFWPQVWLGVSVENQAAADERIPDLLAAPAAVRFLSCEPLLGPLDLWLYLDPMRQFRRHLDWVICGGESGPGKRPTDVAWHRSLRDQCKAAGVAFFEKQIDKVQPIPSDLMVREFPRVA